MSVPQPTDTNPAVILAAIIETRKRLADLEAKYRNGAGQTINPGDRSSIVLDAGPAEVVIGWVSRNKQGYEVYIEDPEAFLAWAKENYPHEVDTIPEVVIPEHVVPEQRTPGWQEVRGTLLAGCKRTALGQVIAPRGEVDPPGLAIRKTSPPTLKVVVDRDAVAEVWPVLSHVFATTVVAELEAGE